MLAARRNGLREQTVIYAKNAALFTSVLLLARTPMFAAFGLLKLQIVCCYGLLWRPRGRPRLFSVVGQELYVIGYFAMICSFAWSNTHLHVPILRLGYVLGFSYSLVVLVNSVVNLVKQKLIAS